MTVAELIELLKDRDPSDVIVVGTLFRHGDNAYALAQDDLGTMRVTVDDEPVHAVVLFTDGEGGDDVELSSHQEDEC